MVFPVQLLIWLASLLIRIANPLIYTYKQQFAITVSFYRLSSLAG